MGLFKDFIIWTIFYIACTSMGAYTISSGIKYLKEKAWFMLGFEIFMFLYWGGLFIVKCIIPLA